MNLSLIILITWLVLLGNCNSQPPVNRKVATWYKLSLQWSPSACYSTSTRQAAIWCSSPGVAVFTIHGLWGQDSTDVVNCDLPYAKIKGPLDNAMEQSLRAYWPDVYANTDYTYFWSWEWGKHGACLFSYQDDYFNRGLKLREDLKNLIGMDLDSFLTTQGLRPGKGVYYARDKFLTAFNNRYRIMPILYCNYEKRRANPRRKPQLQLLELQFCVDPQRWVFVNCTASLGPTAADNYQSCRKATKIGFPG